jgi:hypothetical protein
MDKASADLKAAFAEAGATIGTRTETVQLLRDSMYRICELALNGDLEPDLAGHLHEQYQKSMVTLAAVASLADASRPSQVALAGRSTITRGALMAELSKQIEDEKKVQEEKADASKAAEAAAKSDVGTVCVRKVSESSCVKGAQDCKDDSQGVALCDVKIQNEAATTNDEKLVRTKEYCSAEANSGVAECGTIRKSTSAHETLANSKAAVLQLEKELKEAKSNSDLSAVTQVVTLAPTTVQPRRENIEQIAKVVKCLVTQVYADTHVGYCLRLMSQREGTLQKVAQLNTSIYTLAAKRKISAEVLQSMFTTAGSSVTGPIGGVPNINGKATTEPELNSLFGQMYVKGYEVQKLNDLIEKSCENLSYSLAGKCE